MEMILEILTDAGKDSVKLVPFLFLTYLVMEYLESRSGGKTEGILQKAGRKGPLIGGILGAVPQCGFSAAAASLYSGGVVTAGTMIAVFLSTSDEMLPILISERVDVYTILMILGIKIAVGISAGILVDVLAGMRSGNKQRGKVVPGAADCKGEHCHCGEDGILLSACRHTLQIALFIFAITLLMNVVVEWVGMGKIVKMASEYPMLSVLISGLVGMIPNCAASVTITTLYLEGVLGAGSMLAGLLSCAGVGLLVLFKTNRSWKENLTIAAGLYGISIVSGMVIGSFWG